MKLTEISNLPFDALEYIAIVTKELRLQAYAFGHCSIRSTEASVKEGDQISLGRMHFPKRERDSSHIAKVNYCKSLKYRDVLADTIKEA